jgi:hypothetical protein
VIDALVYEPGVTAVFAKEIAGVAPPDDTIGAVPVTLVTGAVPLEAAVRRPFWSTVIEALVYDAGVTAVSFSEIAGVVPPDDEIGEVPVTLVTAVVPLAAAVSRP